MTTTETATTQADFLLTLASHEGSHPGLSPVNVIYPHHLQLRDTAPSVGYGLVEWADTLTETSVEVLRIDERAFVHIRGRIGEHPVVVWEVVPGLAHAMGAEAFTGTPSTAWITVEAFRAWVESEAVPEAGERPADVPELAGIVS